MSNLHAMFQHPVIAIRTGVQNFCLKSKPISLKISPSDFDKIKEKIGQEVDKYQTFTDATIKEFGLETDQDIKKFQAEGKRDILQSALASDFLDKYLSDLHYENSYEKLLSFITDVIGSQSAAAKSKHAEENMSTMTRDSASEEKFTRFLTRLKRLAKLVTDKEEVQNFLIGKHFQRALSPGLKSFIHEQGQSTKKPEEIAEFLDKMNKNKRTVDLFTVENSETQKEIKQLNEKFDKFQAEMREMFQIQRENPFNFAAVEVNAVSKSAMAKPRPPARNTAPLREQNHMSKESFPSHWELNRYGRPFRCRKCGLRGHRDENCRGTKLTCRLCNKIGHIQPVCPLKNEEPSKN